MATTSFNKEEAIRAITESKPPLTDTFTYLTIVESHLHPDVLPTLNDVLQDAHLTQEIGWDLVQLLIPIPGSEECLKTIARLGNPREVILQVTEALRSLRVDEAGHEEQQGDADEDADADESQAAIGQSKDVAVDTDSGATVVPDEDKFCLLVGVLAKIHPRIQTRYPSRFLSTSLMAVLSAYTPTTKATQAVIEFARAVSGKQRPPLPTRKSSLSIAGLAISTDEGKTAPDPEASAQDPKEEAILQKLLQSFVTHVLEVYVQANSLHWSSRLQEHFNPDKTVPGKKSFSESFKEDEALQQREALTGQIVAIAQDLDLQGYDTLFAILEAPSAAPTPHNELATATGDDEDAVTDITSPEEIPLSFPGSLFLVTASIFSAIKFSKDNATLPSLSIFPELANLVQRFLGKSGIEMTGSENPGVIDAILAIGLWLEHENKFVKGPLEDEDFLQLLQTLSLVAANCPEPDLRYTASVLTSNILHAHPIDRVRLTFIVDTLENCPFETLRAEAVSWLKAELITAQERKAGNIFSTTQALAAVQPYLFPYEFMMSGESDPDLWEDWKRTYPFHMAALNFIYFLKKGGDRWDGVVPDGMLSVVEEIYLVPLKGARERLEKALSDGGTLKYALGEEAADARMEVELLGSRLAMSSE